MSPKLGFLLLVDILFIIFLEIHCTLDPNRFWKHYRWSNEYNNGRTRRQLGFGGSPQQIDLNITVPFIFSARLYPYGPNRGDQELPAGSSSIPLVLRNDLAFFAKNYSTIYILRDGAIGLKPGAERANRAIPFPSGPPMIATFWTPLTLGKVGKVYFRETEEKNILNLVRSEVQIQYRYSDDFKPTSVVIVTWQNVAPPGAPDNYPDTDRNIFQVALILSQNGTFAHFVYSKLKWHNNAVAGFNEGVSGGSFLSLPGSGTPDSMLLANESDIGIPGEWLFKLDGKAVRLCGPGFKGMECIKKCDASEWSYDCADRCYCEGRDATCNPVSGLCPGSNCREGWDNFPHCDIDVDECEERGPESLCPAVQPDCINTPGAYLCMCLTGYDTAGECKGTKGLPQIALQNHAPNQLIEISPDVNTRRITPNAVHPSVAVNARPPAVQQVQQRQQQSFTPGQTFFPVNQGGGRAGPAHRDRGISITPITPPPIYIQDSNRLPPSSNRVQQQNRRPTQSQNNARSRTAAPEQNVVVALSPKAPTVSLTPSRNSHVNVVQRPSRPPPISARPTATQGGRQATNPRLSYESQIARVADPKSLVRKSDGGRPPPRLIIPHFLSHAPTGPKQPVINVQDAVQQVKAVPVAVGLPETTIVAGDGVGQSLDGVSEFESVGAGAAVQVPLNQRGSGRNNNDPVSVPLLTPPPIFIVNDDENQRNHNPNVVQPLTPPPIYLQPAEDQGSFPSNFPTDGGDLSPVRPTIVNPGNIQSTAQCSLQCGEHSHCETNINGFPSCVCNKGWAGDGIFCVDINECFLDNPCANGAQCQNTLGSYSCQCQTGFKSEGSRCVDINECAEGVIQCPGSGTSMCFNTHGSYECRCKPGFNGDPASSLGCVDINECLIPEFYCGENAQCSNTNGGFRCQCADGFLHDKEKNACVDVDECLSSPCSRAAVCTNSPGSYTCRCLTGYDGDGLTCQETILFPFDYQRDHALPPLRNAVIEVPLDKPIVILGQEFRRVYVSSNGLVTFDQPMRDFDSRPLSNIRMLGLAPLYMPVDLSRGGSVYYRETTDAPHFAVDFSSLTRGSLSVQEDFQEPGFRAHSIFVVTYKDVLPLGASDDRKRSTVQIVLIMGESGTYVTYIYDVVAHPQAQAGILSPNVSQVLVLPDSASNAVKLAETSNLAQPGKWMFRIDRPLVVQCPAGRASPPFCHQACQPGFWGQSCARVCRCEGGVPCDYKSGKCLSKKCQTGYTGDNCQKDIDECNEKTDRCHAQARCKNIQGSYTCTCIDGYTGDGFTCSELDRCVAVFGSACDLHATCSHLSNGSPQCVCSQGYRGNGFQCTADSNPGAHLQPVVPVQKLPAPFRPPPIVSQRPGPVQPNPTGVQRPPPRPEPALPPVTIFTPKPFINNNRIDNEQRTTRRPPATTRRPLLVHGNRLDNNRESSSRNAVLSGSRGGQRRGSSTSSTSNMLVIIIPAILCGVWLILIVVLLLVCLRRRKRRQEKQGLGYYLPPTAGKDTHSAAGWAIPRPAYEYYQGTASYYPAASDPYGSYT